MDVMSPVMAIRQFARWPLGAGSCLQLLKAQWGSRWSAALNWLTDSDSTACAGRLFQASITLFAKKCLRMFSLALGFSSLYRCPLDCLELMLKKVRGSTFTSPLMILNTSVLQCDQSRFL